MTRVVELHLRAAPGVRGPIDVESFEPGLVVLYGPNASGKSTIGRTLRAMLWRETAPPGIDAQALWIVDESGEVRSSTVVHGRTSWDAGRPELPDALESRSLLTLYDLLTPDADSDGEIAREIQTQLDGGYDLGDRALEAHVRRPKTEWKTRHKEAVRDLQNLDAAADDLNREETEIGRLEAHAAAARAASARLQLVDKARQRLEVRAELEQASSTLAEFPSELEALPVGALETAERLGERLARLRAQEKEGAAKLADAESDLHAHAFPAEPPTRAQDAELDARAIALVRAAEECARLDREAAGAAALVEAESKHVWVDATTAGLPSREVIEGLDEALGELAAARAHLNALPAPAAPAREPMDDRERERCEQARMLLRDWLAAPRADGARGGQPGRRGRRRAFVIGGAALAVVGLVLVSLGVGGGALLAAFGVGLAAAAIGLGGHGSAAHGETNEPRAIERSFREKQLDEPERWVRADVVRAVADLDERLLDHDRAVRDAERSRQAEAERTRVAATVAELESRVAAIVETCGLSPDLADLGLAVQARRVGALADALAGAESARAEAKTASKKLADDLGALFTLAASFLPSGTEPFLDAAAAHAAVQAIGVQRESHENAAIRVDAAGDALHATRDDLERASTEYAEHMRACGLGEEDLPKLRRIAGDLEAYDELRNRIRDAQRELDRTDDPALADLPDTAAELDAERARLDEQSREFEALTTKIADIRARVKTAINGRSFAEAASRRDEALDELAAHRDEQFENCAAGALLGWLRSERRAGDEPPLLRRADEWFRRFTHDRYRLEVDAELGFVARELDTRTPRALHALSDGTRVQLLLAARLAFVEDAERNGPKVPLFLDEVLTTADPERFEAVANAILEMASDTTRGDGRQVIYATADAAEVAAWQRIAAAAGRPTPQVIDIGESEPDPEWASVPALASRPDVPPPGDMDAITYVAALGVRRPGVFDPVESWPLPLVLHDALDIARAAFEQGWQHAGQLWLLRDGVPSPLPDKVAQLATARLGVIEATVDALRVGRDRPVTWDDIMASDAVSHTFQDRLRDALPDDATAADCMAAVDGLKHFNTGKKEQLREHLRSAGLLADEPRLTDAEVLARAQRAGDVPLRARLMSLADVAELVALVRAVVIRP